LEYHPLDEVPAAEPRTPNPGILKWYPEAKTRARPGVRPGPLQTATPSAPRGEKQAPRRKL